MPYLSTVERAFQIAELGVVEDLEDIRRQLLREGHASVREHLEGLGVKVDLCKRLNAAKARRQGSL